jgi:hypothetical protein
MSNKASRRARYFGRKRAKLVVARVDDTELPPRDPKRDRNAAWDFWETLSEIESPKFLIQGIQLEDSSPL